MIRKRREVALAEMQIRSLDKAIEKSNQYAEEARKAEADIRQLMETAFPDLKKRRRVTGC